MGTRLITTAKCILKIRKKHLIFLEFLTRRETLEDLTLSGHAEDMIRRGLQRVTYLTNLHE